MSKLDRRLRRGLIEAAVERAGRRGPPGPKPRAPGADGVPVAPDLPKLLNGGAAVAIPTEGA